MEDSAELTTDANRERAILALVYTKITVLLCACACFYLMGMAYRLSVNPPELYFDLNGQRVLVTLVVQETVLLWMRIIGLLYGAMALLAGLSLPFLLYGIQENNSCFVITWMMMNLLVIMLAMLAIMFSYMHDYERFWILLPIPLLLYGFAIWIQMFKMYKTMPDERMRPMNGELSIMESMTRAKCLCQN